MKERFEHIVSWLRSPGDGLRERVLHSGVWASLLNVSDRIIKITQVVILARFLSPADFGVMGIALLLIAIMTRISDPGIEPALIQRERDNIDEFLNTAWTTQLVRTTGIAVLLLFAAPLVAAFFGSPQVEPVLQVLALSVVLQYVRNPAVVYFKKELEFHKQFVYQLSGTIVNFTVAIALAVSLGNVWALVAGVVAGRATTTTISYLMDGYRPKLAFDEEKFWSLFGFGKWMWATGFVVLVATIGDDTFVGWYLPAAALGLYQMAFRLSNAPATEVTHVISGVMFPTYSKVQNNTEKLREAFLGTVRVVYVITIPMAIGILLVASEFTAVVLGESWLPMVPAMQIMALAGAARAIAATGGAVFQGVGQPEWDFRMNLIRAAVIVLTVFPLTGRFGITGAAASITLGIYASLPVWIYKTREITGVLARDHVESLLVPTLATALMIYPVLYLAESSLFRLTGAVVTGIVIYVITILVVFPDLAVHRSPISPD